MRQHNSRLGRFFWLINFAVLLLNLPLALSTSVGESPGKLIINEFLAANQAILADVDGDYSDWIEIHNLGPQAINLAGWSLSDDPNQPEKWTFPDIMLGSGEYLLVFASGKDRKPAQPGAELHTNFELNRSGEFLGLYNIFESRFVDIASPAGLPPPEIEGEVGFPEQLDDVAYGRYRAPANELVYGYLANPTPGKPNDETSVWADLLGPVEFSAERGFYAAPFTLELTTTASGATIRYTLDGSDPTETHGAIYTAPLKINTTTLLRAAAFKPNFRPSLIDTHTYIFLDEVLAQPGNPSGFPKTWGGYKGVPVTADYEMDPEVVTDPRYADIIEEALTSIPTISIVMNRQNFHDLYANPKRKGRAWERPASIEFIDPHQHQPGFQINAGLRIHGELGRSEYMPKHPLRLFFRSEYGAARLNYPLFPGSSIEEFDTLILRSGVNRSYAGYPEREEEIKLTTYTRDEWLRASQLAMSGFGARGLFVHLYLNGLYWGLYNIVERPDATFMSSYFGGVEEDWQVIDQEETLTNTSERFKALHKLASESQLEDPANYAAIKTYLDIPHFIDYLILNWYSGNLDWGFNNWFAGVQNPAGQVRYFVWDGERTWYEGAEIYMEFDEYLEQPNLVKSLFQALLENPDFRLELADRMYKHLFHEGALADANSQARWLSLNAAIEQAIIGESARWGDTRFETPLTQADWFKARDDVLAQMDGNAAQLITLAREAGYYPTLDPPLFSQQGGQIEAGFQLTIALSSSQEAAIYYTTDGSDPKLSTTTLNANRYNTPLILTATTHVKARAWADGVWSALNEATFKVAEQSSQIAITEIMYNPAGGNDYEFIELKNVGQKELNLVNMSIEDGIFYTFPPGLAPLAPGEWLVLTRNPEAFARRYPDLRVTGPYQGKLANQGETITLRDAAGHILASISYDDENGWPLSPDGQGDSLVIINPEGPPDNPQNWRASASPAGSPGTDEPGQDD
jgi:hypothetical protein